MVQAHENDPGLQAGSFRPVVAALSTSIGIAVVSAWGVFDYFVPAVMVSFANGLGILVPSIEKISALSSYPVASATVLSVQWALLPLHLFAWFKAAPPWAPRVRNAVTRKAQQLKGSQRLLFLIGYLFLGMWLLGDLGVLDFPTLYNGKYAYPPSDSMPQLRMIYTSSIALTIYAWMSPLIEVVCLWMFVLFTVNFGRYITPSGEPT